MKEVLAALVALFLVIVMVPGTASAVSVDPSSTISDTILGNGVADDPAVDILAGPYFWNATFSPADGTGDAYFVFTNSSAVNQTVGVTIGTILQSVLPFVGGVTVAWDSGESAFIAGGVSDVFSISTVIGALGSDTLSIIWGDPTSNNLGAHSTIDITVQAVPLPAPLLLLLTALSGLGFISYRRRTA